MLESILMNDGILTLQERASALGTRFAHEFGEPAAGIFQAPGRVNLIGEHTDYNEGFVLPAALGFSTHVAVAPRRDSKLIVRSQNYSEQVEFDVARLPEHGRGHWSDYIVGVAKLLPKTSGPLVGANLMIEGDVPHGAGLSSSASLEVATASALADLIGAKVGGTDLALLCQRAENDFVGTRCGIMDQFVAVHGQRNHALLLDCRSLEYRVLPLPDHIRLVICNTMVRHAHSNGEYNTRRAECEAGVRFLANKIHSLRSLRDVNLDQLNEMGRQLPETVKKRCRHVITENARVLQAAAALEAGDLRHFGELMRRSHRSLRDDFEVSCEELDLMVELNEKVGGVYGARMTGGGFGGCTISLVEAQSTGSFKLSVREAYRRATGLEPEIYICSASDGAGRVT
jgi:galactokinase